MFPHESLESPSGPVGPPRPVAGPKRVGPTSTTPAHGRTAPNGPEWPGHSDHGLSRKGLPPFHRRRRGAGATSSEGARAIPEGRRFGSQVGGGLGRRESWAELGGAVACVDHGMWVACQDCQHLKRKVLRARMMLLRREFLELEGPCRFWPLEGASVQ